jgi:hypothetical protein
MLIVASPFCLARPSRSAANWKSAPPMATPNIQPLPGRDASALITPSPEKVGALLEARDEYEQ